MNLAALFGSDVFVRYTADYSWRSNQMAHGMMGFFGATLMAYAYGVLGLAPVWAITFMVIPFLKDLTDYLADLAQESAVFQIKPTHLAEMRRDALTDNLFWNIGAVLAVLFAVAQDGKGFWFWLMLALVIVFAALVLFWALPHYSAEKRRFDKAGLPFFFRLPNFTGNPAAVREVTADGSGEWQAGRAGAVAVVEAFAYAESDEPAHLVIDGPSGTRKTPLAVGIGSGATVRNKSVRFLSQSTLIEEIRSGSPQAERADTEPLDPRDADLVVVDDVVAPVSGGTVPDWLQSKRTVWVTSGGDAAEAAINALRTRLNGPLEVVRLDEPKPDEALTRKKPTFALQAIAFIGLAVPAVLLLGSLALVFFG